jgi:hypothetical protein
MLHQKATRTQTVTKETRLTALGPNLAAPALLLAARREASASLRCRLSREERHAPSFARYAGQRLRLAAIEPAGARLCRGHKNAPAPRRRRSGSRPPGRRAWTRKAEPRRDRGADGRSIALPATSTVLPLSVEGGRRGRVRRLRARPARCRRQQGALLAAFLWVLVQEPDVDPARVPEATGATIRRDRRRDRNRLDGVADQPSPRR